MARLLVVDDEQSMRVMLEARLAKAGHAVDVAPNVAGVDRALAASEFDVVITDLRMRTGGDGLDVVRKVKAAQPEAEVILMTAFGSDDVRRQALELGAYGYVEKSPTLASELFGHAKGAFTGAQAAKEGLFQAAQDGTLFLDEIGELPLSLQVKLLRAIQERRIRPVGDNSDVDVDVRLVAATNRDLAAEVRAGRFREDLYYRLNVVEIRVPALRERREDVLPLADHFLRRFAAEHSRPLPRLSADAKRRLSEYWFPGNVRELENLIERAVALSSGDEVTVDALPPVLRGNGAHALSPEGPLPEGFALEEYLARIQRELTDTALTESGGVKKDAAARLGLTFRQFRHRV